MAKLTTRPGRNGFYLVVPVPSKLRKRLGKSAVYRKAGNTKQEALRHRVALLVEIENEFRRLMKEDVVAEVVRQVDPSSEDFMDLLDQTLRQRGYRGGTDNLHTDQKLADQYDAAVSGTTDYQDWIQKRIVEQAPAKNTIATWEGRLRSLAEWFSSDHLATMTKDDAVRWKNEKIKLVKNTSLGAYINTFGGFWTWLKDNGQVTDNIWDGLSRKLKIQYKQDSVDLDLLGKAKAIADSKYDIGFWLQYYSGCRKADHQGLRWCDINMSDETITFEEYQADGVIRTLKGGTSDERTIPIHPELIRKLKQMLPSVVHNDDLSPIWAEQYRPKKESFGDGWAQNFSKRYGFNSHKLRSYVVTQLINSNVSPYMLHAVTRHSVPGMSQVVKGYVRPTKQQLQDVINRLT